jgi:hypothetical protein
MKFSFVGKKVELIEFDGFVFCGDGYWSTLAAQQWSLILTAIILISVGQNAQDAMCFNIWVLQLK